MSLFYLLLSNPTLLITDSELETGLSAKTRFIYLKLFTRVFPKIINSQSVKYFIIEVGNNVVTAKHVNIV